MTENDCSIGLYVPPYVRNCPGLTPLSWVLLGLIIQLGKRRPCTTSVRTLSELCRLNRRTVARLLNELAGRRLLVREGKEIRAAEPDDAVWRQPAPGPSRRKVARPAAARRAAVATERRTAAQAEPAEAGDAPEPREPPRPRRTRATTPLEEKLLDISGLRHLVGTKVFPGGRFGKCLAALKELNATPGELDRYVVWWREQAMSFRRDFPTLEQIATTFHQSRLAAAGGTLPDAAGPRRSDSQPLALRDPGEFNRRHQMSPEQLAETLRFRGWMKLDRPVMEAIELARQGVEPPAEAGEPRMTQTPAGELT